jgi:hypothetical protein
MGETLINHVVPVIEDHSCATWSLAFYLGIPLADVIRAVTLIDSRDMGRHGLSIRTIQRVAKSLGSTLRLKRSPDLDEIYGILVLSQHVAVVRNGLTFETDGTVWDVEHYLLEMGEVPEGVLVAVE